MNSKYYIDKHEKELEKEVKKYYKKMKKKKYKDKEDWEKFLNDDHSKYKKRQKKIREFEVLVEPSKLDYLKG